MNFDDYLSQWTNHCKGGNTSDSMNDDDDDFTGLAPDIIYKLNKLPAELRRLVKMYLDKDYSYNDALALAERDLEKMKETEKEKEEKEMEEEYGR